MDTFIVLDIRSILPPHQIRQRRKKPEYCAFPVVGIPWEIIPLETCEIALQKKDLTGASTRLMEVNASSASSVRIIVRRASVFLLFVLRGQARFYDNDGQFLSSAKEAVFFLAYGPVGRFSIQLEKGLHSLLMINIDDNWLFPSRRTAYPGFVSLFDLWHSKAHTPLSLSQKPLSLRIRNILIHIRTAIVENMDDGLSVLSSISACLNHYHAQLLDQKELNRKADLTKAKQLRAHLSRIYTFDEECRTKRIEEKLGWSSWTLRITAKKALGTTISQYVQSLRIQKAAQLLTTTDMQVREISTIVGFSSSSIFIRVFKKIKGVTPSTYRKREVYSSHSKKSQD